MHDALYTSGTEFYLATGDIYATQQLLGHADVSTTANIYVQGSPADLRRSSGRSGRVAADNDSDRRSFDRTVPIEKASIAGRGGGGGSRTRVRSRTDSASTSLVRPCISLAGRRTDALPTSQPS